MLTIRPVTWRGLLGADRSASLHLSHAAASHGTAAARGCQSGISAIRKHVIYLGSRTNGGVDLDPLRSRKIGVDMRGPRLLAHENVSAVHSPARGSPLSFYSFRIATDQLHRDAPLLVTSTGFPNIRL